MIYIYCRRPSDSAFELATALGGRRLRRFDGMDFWRKGKRLTLAEGDIVIAWGDPLPEMDGIRILNGAEIPNKFQTAIKLSNEDIQTVQVTDRMPYGKDPRWLPRMNNHVGGNDLLKAPQVPDYWSFKVELVEEYRIHSFDQKSMRAGKKILREGYAISEDVPPGTPLPDGKLAAHPWVRSYEGGWRVVYDGFQSNKAMRTLAHKAVAALGLTFGAVDIGKTKDGDYIVLEVNRAPGLEGGSITAYVNAINRWINDAGRTGSGSKGSGSDIRPEREQGDAPVEDVGALQEDRGGAAGAGAPAVGAHPAGEPAEGNLERLRGAAVAVAPNQFRTIAGPEAHIFINGRRVAIAPVANRGNVWYYEWNRNYFNSDGAGVYRLCRYSECAEAVYQQGGPAPANGVLPNEVQPAPAPRPARRIPGGIINYVDERQQLDYNRLAEWARQQQLLHREVAERRFVVPPVAAPENEG